ncbi:MAG TPA: hypothetical protein VLA23_14015 [Candidatus Limnocylindrales bacterium]|nr:hypothetical protein [Candidatus Limnocylindrales bacterium]
MTIDVLLPGLTALVAFVLALALLDQWLERRRPYQLVWTAGIAFYGIASVCSAIGYAVGWTEPVFRVWYLAGALWTAAWLGLGTAFLLGRTRFGYTVAATLVIAAVATIGYQRRNEFEGVGSLPLLYFIAAAVLALAVAVETYFQNERWPRIAAVAVGGATVLSIVLMATTPLLGPVTTDAAGLPDLVVVPGSIRLLSPFLNITGGLTLAFGAVFSAYVFMPKRRVLDYSLDPTQPGDQFLFNLAISPVAIVVNFVASLPAALRALVAGQLNSRVPATLLIAAGGFLASGIDAFIKLGYTSLFELSKLVALLLIFAGFLVSIEVFREIRVPFTRIRIATGRREHPAALAEESAPPRG